MNYLAIDASTEACSVALVYQGEIYSRYQFCPQSHSLMLLPMVDEVLQEAGVKLAQLDGLIYGRGPGSFTGVRIGIGVAQGLAFSADLQVVGISTLQTMAQQAFDANGDTDVIASIDARMSETYSGLFRVDANNLMQPVKPEAVIAPSLVADYISSSCERSVTGVGSAWLAYAAELSSAMDQVKVNSDIEFPNAIAMLALGKVEFAKNNAVNAEHAVPVYLRDTVSWKKLPGRE